VGLGDLFKLSKLTIRGYTSSDHAEELGTFEVQYNPETLSLHHESVYQGQQAAGTTSDPNQWAFNKPARLAVNLIVDGTGVGYLGVELLKHIPTVAERIQSFLSICRQVKGKSHEPAYLRLEWDKGVLGSDFFCRLESVDINYKTFDRDGSPLQAELAAVFVKRLEPKTEAKTVGRESPDLTHRRVVIAGDTLPLLCREIYGSAAYYLRVAQVNRLEDFRDLRPGQELIFPPFGKAGRP
jgi:hypothetical protein